MPNRPHPYSIIIFDFNDVLSPSNYYNVFRRNQALIGIDVKILMNTYKNAGLLSRLMTGDFDSETHFWESVANLTNTNVDILLRIATEIAEEKTIDEDVMHIVTALKKDYTLAILTNNYRETFSYWVRKFGLHLVFDKIWNSADYGMLKSDVRLYETVLREMGISGTSAIMIDDNLTNLYVASRVGMTPILFTDASSLKQKLSEKRIQITGQK